MPACIPGNFLRVTKGFFGFPGYLRDEAFDLLLLAAGQFTSLLLYFTGDVFCSSFDLIFVQFSTPFLIYRQSLPVGHFKIPHLWPPKIPQAGRADYELVEAF